MRVAGIDGSKKGWVCVLLERGALAGVRAYEDFEAAVSDLTGVEFIGIDIPLGLPDTGGREADVEARKLLGSRGSTVFAVPSRGALKAASYDEAKALAEPRRKPSRQAYGLGKKILQVNDSPRLDARFFEVHPEISFFEMAGRESVPSKKSWNGLWRRLDLLTAAGIQIPRNLVDQAGEAGPDDVLDAAAAAWSAVRKSEGQAKRLPAAPQYLSGRDAAIWY
jgi:predicted RNase H-like nuclease